MGDKNARSAFFNDSGAQSPLGNSGAASPAHSSIKDHQRRLLCKSTTLETVQRYVPFLNERSPLGSLLEKQNQLSSTTQAASVSPMGHRRLFANHSLRHATLKTKAEKSTRMRDEWRRNAELFMPDLDGAEASNSAAMVEDSLMQEGTLFNAANTSLNEDTAENPSGLEDLATTEPQH